MVVASGGKWTFEVGFPFLPARRLCVISSCFKMCLRTVAGR